MDPQILLAIILFALTVVWIWMNKSSSKTQQGKLPPGPWKLPLIGNMHHFISSLPHRCLRDLANRHGPVMPYLPAARILFYDFTDIGFASYGDYWRQLRKICALEQLRAKRAGSPVNLRKLLRALTSNITARAAFGAKCKDREAFSQVVQEAVEIVGGFSLTDAFLSAIYLRGGEKAFSALPELPSATMNCSQRASSSRRPRTPLPQACQMRNATGEKTLNVGVKIPKIPQILLNSLEDRAELAVILLGSWQWSSLGG
ncbi:Detected protein of unknown function [Hibiscus syriacus]|uniref:Uncharacterized protein n=1 Tax=Hibiscus syriacus TaxID=106335 RepID=A0A6A2YLV7_HIBSY|nr:Detected protein of unknown function [Hibiscus syriacus]